VSREIAERIATGMVAFWRDRVRHLPGHVIHEVDGVVVCLTGLDDDEQNTALIERAPDHAAAALTEAEGVFRAHGRSLGVDVERGRHPDVDAALGGMGLEMVATRPAMAVRVHDVEPVQVPEGVEIVRVTDPELLAGLVDVEVGAFETDRAVAEGLLAPSQLSLPNVRLYAALVDGRAVAQAVTNMQGGAVGVFGVATLPEYRRRGIGTAITAFAIDDVRDEADLAWLQSTAMGRTLYERMGFRPVSEWDVWVRGVKPTATEGTSPRAKGSNPS
jgi:predicted GNAT family acetyltransferase